jgi:hypothetical protein
VDVADFDFELPPELIAQNPPPERSDARLLLLARGTGVIAHSAVSALPALLQPGDLLVVNNTRVFPARLLGHRVPSGGSVECVLLTPAPGQLWEALVHPGQKLKPGARMAISSWGEPDQVPFLSIPMRTTMERLEVPPPPAGTPGPLSRPTPAAIGGLLERGGFSKVAVEQDEVTFEFDSPEQFTAYIRAISAPIRAMIEQYAGDAREEAWDAITRAAADAGGGSKPLSFSNVVLLASGTA